MICGKCGQKREKIYELYVHWQSTCESRAAWQRVIDAKKEGNFESAARIARKAMGVEGPEMSEETKEKLRQYREEHKEEISAKEKLKRMASRRLRMITKPRGKR